MTTTTISTTTTTTTTITIAIAITDTIIFPPFNTILKSVEINQSKDYLPIYQTS